MNRTKKRQGGSASGKGFAVCGNRAGMRQLRMRHGGTTIFLCLLLSALVPLCCILTDLARWQLAQTRVRNAVQLAAESLLAGYDRPLREQYALFGLAESSSDLLAARAEQILEANLEADSIPDGTAPVADLFGLKVETVQAEAFGSLSQAEVLRAYAADSMRYRAPVQLAAGFLEKLDAFRGAVDETDVIRTDMALERARAAVREDLVRLHLLLTTRLPGLGIDDQTPGALLVERIDALLRENGRSVRAAACQYNDTVTRLNALQPEVRRCRASLEQAQSVVQNAQREAEEAEKSLAEALVAGKTEGTDGRQAPAGSAVMGADAPSQAISELRALLLVRSAAATSAMREAERCRTELAVLVESEWEPSARICADALDKVCASQAEAMCAEEALVTHLERHRRTLVKASELAGTLVGALERIGPQAVAAVESAKASGTLSQGHVEASAARAPAFPDGKTMEQVRAGADAGALLLDGWARAVSHELGQARVLLRESETALAVFREAAAEPGRESAPLIPPLSARFACDPLQGADLSQLAGLTGISRMQQTGTLVIPAFDPGQPASELEIAEYEEWLSAWSGDSCPAEVRSGQSAEDAGDRSGGKTLRSIREAASRTARMMRGEDGGGDGEASMGIIPEALRVTLPSVALTEEQSLHPLSDTGAGNTAIHERRDNCFTQSLDRVAQASEQFGSLQALSGRQLVERLWEDAYILSAFKHAGTPESGIPHDLAWGRDLSSTVFKKGEVEYILFGFGEEKTNRMAMKGTLFGVRLGMNLCHVYASAPKRASTLALAGLLAGWTGFGIPVVQHFLMIAWAAAESCVDLDRLLRGETVPLVKTETSWFLSAGSFRGTLVQQLVLDPLKGHVAGALGERIGRADQAVRETVGGWTDAAVESVFAPLEAQCADFGRQIGEGMLEASEGIPQKITGSISDFLAGLPVDGRAEPLTQQFGVFLNTWLETFRQTCAEAVAGMTVAQVAALRERVKAEVRGQLFGSGFYAALVEQARTTSMGLVDAGFDRLEQQADGILGRGTTPDALKAGITGRMATLSYEEYLALFLLLMPQQTKTERTADLIQINLGSALGTEAYSLAARNTCVRLAVGVRMDFWFIPDSLADRMGLSHITSETVRCY